MLREKNPDLRLYSVLDPRIRVATARGRRA
jgi:hypothetical protein